MPPLDRWRAAGKGFNYQAAMDQLVSVGLGENNWIGGAICLATTLGCGKEGTF